MHIISLIDHLISCFSDLTFRWAMLLLPQHLVTEIDCHPIIVPTHLMKSLFLE